MAKDNMKVVIDKIRKIFDFLKTEITTEQYSVVLLLIYLHSKKMLAKTITTDKSTVETHYDKKLLIKVLYDIGNPSLNKVCKIFLPTIISLRGRTLSTVLNFINSIDSDFLNKNIVEIYDDTLDKIVLSQSRRL